MEDKKYFLASLECADIIINRWKEGLVVDAGHIIERAETIRNVAFVSLLQEDLNTAALEGNNLVIRINNEAHKLSITYLNQFLGEETAAHIVTEVKKNPNPTALRTGADESAYLKTLNGKVYQGKLEEVVLEMETAFDAIFESESVEAKLKRTQDELIKVQEENLALTDRLSAANKRIDELEKTIKENSNKYTKEKEQLIEEWQEKVAKTRESYIAQLKELQDRYNSDIATEKLISAAIKDKLKMKSRFSFGNITSTQADPGIKEDMPANEEITPQPEPAPEPVVKIEPQPEPVPETPAYPPATGTFPASDMINILDKNELTFTYQQFALTSVDGEQTYMTGDLVIYPMSTKDMYPDLMVWAAFGNEQTMTKCSEKEGKNTVYLTLNGYTVCVTGRVEGDRFIPSVYRPNKYKDKYALEKGASSDFKGKGGHIILTDSGKEVHIAPINFSNDETGTANFAYAIKDLDSGKYEVMGDNSEGDIYLTTDTYRRIVCSWNESRIAATLSLAKKEE